MERSTDNSEKKRKHPIANEKDNRIRTFRSAKDRTNIATFLAKIGIRIDYEGGWIVVRDDVEGGNEDYATTITANQIFLDQLIDHSPDQCSLRLFVKRPAPTGDGGEMILSVLGFIKELGVHSRACDASSWISLIAGKLPFCEFLCIDCAIIGNVGCNILLDHIRSGGLTKLEFGVRVAERSTYHEYWAIEQWAPYWEISKDIKGCWNINMEHCNLSDLRGIIFLTTFVQHESSSLDGTMTQLQSVRLSRCTFGNKSFDVLANRDSNECWNIYMSRCNLSEVRGVYALTTFIQHERTKLQSVKLAQCTFGNEQLDVLAKAKEVILRDFPINASEIGMLVSSIQNNLQLTRLAIHSRISYFDGVEVWGIEPAGCQMIASFLQNPNCNLKTLEISDFPFDDECASILARGLRGNNTLQIGPFGAGRVNNITQRGWSAFSKAICNITSINDIYFSNHTIKKIRIESYGIPSIKLNRLLVFNNSSTDRKEIALKKIIRYKGRLYVSSLFELDLQLKLLPTLVNWFDGASVSLNSYKNDAIYQFIQANAELS